MARGGVINPMRVVKVKVVDNKKLKKDVFLISFCSSYIARRAGAGNFLHIRVPGRILRRPFSIHKVDKDVVYVLFRVRGRGTAVLSGYKRGDVLDVLGPLGTGFDLNCSKPGFPCILIAGGMGAAPLVFLAQRLRIARSLRPGAGSIVLLGAKNKKEILCASEFRGAGFKVKIATEDASCGAKGTVCGLLKKELSAIGYGACANVYACGPNLMLKAVGKIIKRYPNVNCQASFEQFMGCGIGACCGCVIETKNGYRKICKDGPVFDLKDIY